VVISDDQIDAELARPKRRLGAPDAAIHRDHQGDAFGMQAVDGHRLQAVAVAETLRNEMHDVAPEKLEGPPQDDG
jgi:hypothetical protein